MQSYASNTPNCGHARKALMHKRAGVIIAAQRMEGRIRPKSAHIWPKWAPHGSIMCQLRPTSAQFQSSTAQTRSVPGGSWPKFANFGQNSVKLSQELTTSSQLWTDPSQLRQM